MCGHAGLSRSYVRDGLFHVTHPPCHPSGPRNTEFLRRLRPPMRAVTRQARRAQPVQRSEPRQTQQSCSPLNHPSSPPLSKWPPLPATSSAAVTPPPRRLRCVSTCNSRRAISRAPRPRSARPRWSLEESCSRLSATLLDFARHARRRHGIECTGASCCATTRSFPSALKTKDGRRGMIDRDEVATFDFVLGYRDIARECVTAG